jgi:hypothetical protein
MFCDAEGNTDSQQITKHTAYPRFQLLNDSLSYEVAKK